MCTNRNIELQVLVRKEELRAAGCVRGAESYGLVSQKGRSEKDVRTFARYVPRCYRATDHPQEKLL